MPPEQSRATVGDPRDEYPLPPDDYVTKPSSVVVLAARIRALVRRGPAPRATTLAVQDLVLDPATRRCTRRDQPIDLTLRELALLRYLMSRAGGVVAKEELLRQVWNDEIQDPDIVRVYIGNLRRKIDEPFGRRLLTTCGAMATASGPTGPRPHRSPTRGRGDQRRRTADRDGRRRRGRRVVDRARRRPVAPPPSGPTAGRGPVQHRGRRC